MYKSPNGTLRNSLNGTIFREPIIISNIPRLVPHWRKPIIIGRHAFADQYMAIDFPIAKGSKLVVSLKDEEGKTQTEHVVHSFTSSAGVGLCMFNRDDVFLLISNM